MTVAPDQGMAELLARMHGPADGGQPPGPAADLDIMVRLAAALESNAAAVERQRRADDVNWELVHPVPLNPIVSNAAGPITDERWGPHDGWAWHVVRVTAVFGTGATSCIVYQDLPTANNQLQTLATTGVPWEPRALILMPGQLLVPAGQAGGVTVNGQAIEIKLSYLPRYLS